MDNLVRMVYLVMLIFSNAIMTFMSLVLKIIISTEMCIVTHILHNFAHGRSSETAKAHRG
eukprot:TRINITY_DN1543_c0_g1_i2.p2 TRINITY_DN1543_c0_g1~~TRINITY_DN1543_c0_g1_i2.p2  ORF type:complete len:60 (+),score=14.63 TRINITY_DN1543_c0_g1_i2:195-374(+)